MWSHGMSQVISFRIANSRSILMVNSRSMASRKILICLFGFVLGSLFTLRFLTEDYSARNDARSSTPPVDSQQHAVFADLYQFEHASIRYINRTPGFRYYDDYLMSSQNNIYLAEYKLHYCKIDKNMGSTMQAFLCYIDAPQNHSKFFFNGIWNPGLTGSACATSTTNGDLRKRFVTSAQSIDFFNEKSGIYHLAIVRDPVKRFISAFVDVCVINTLERQLPQKFKTLCFSCRSNLTCFLPQLHDYLYRISEHLPKERWFRDWHFYPQAWYCDFDRHIKRYHLIHYKRNDMFYQTLVEFLRNIRVKSNLVNDVETQLRTKTVAHETYSKSFAFEKELLESPRLLEYVYKIYYMDFVWFDYRL